MAIEKPYVNNEYEFSPPETVLDSGFHAVDSRYLALDSGRFFVSGTGIPDSSARFRILDSSSCILDSKAKDFGFYKKNFPDSTFHKQKVPGFPHVMRKSDLSFLSSYSPRCLTSIKRL